MGRVALRDPQLQVHVLGAHGHVFTGLTEDDARSQILHVLHVGHDLLVGVAHQQVGCRKRAAILVAQFAHQVVDVARNRDLGIEVQVLAKQAQRLAVEHGLDVGEAALSLSPDLVGSAHLDCTGTGEREPLAIGRDHLERALHVE